MKILIFGATGMLGQSLMREANQRNINAKGVARSDTDFCLNIADDEALKKIIKRERPEIIINAAAITNLKLCENDPSLAYRINARPLSIIAEISREINAYLIQISTDHYFINDSDKKHGETSPVHLVNEYARTKYAGEVFALAYPGALAVRTNIIGFRNKKGQPTLVEWIIKALEKKMPITLFDDFYSSSIHVRQFSKALFDIINKRPVGILNLASVEVCNKKKFIEEIASRLNYSLSRAKLGSVFELTDARRAESLGLDVSLAEKILGYQLPTLNQVVDSLISEYKELVQ